MINITYTGSQVTESIPSELQAEACKKMALEALDALKAEKARGSTWAMVGLVYDWPEFERLFEKAVSRFGSVEILINNAAIFEPARLGGARVRGSS